MSETDRFSSISRRIKKNFSASGGSATFQQLREAFVSCLPNIPDTLKYDMAIYFCGEYAPTDNIDEFTPLSEKLLEAVYLYEEEYDRIDESFSENDWIYIRESVSEFALELDPDLITYIMRQVVSRGLIG